MTKSRRALALNRETVRELTEDRLESAHGGRDLSLNHPCSFTCLTPVVLTLPLDGCLAVTGTTTGTPVH
jgi:hypothetical protein